MREFRNLENVTFKSSLLHGEHGTRNVRIFLRFHVKLPFLVSCLVHLINRKVCSNFLSALAKNTPDNFSQISPKQQHPFSLFDFRQTLIAYKQLSDLFNLVARLRSTKVCFSSLKKN